MGKAYYRTPAFYGTLARAAYHGYRAYKAHSSSKGKSVYASTKRRGQKPRYDGANTSTKATDVSAPTLTKQIDVKTYKTKGKKRTRYSYKQKRSFRSFKKKVHKVLKKSSGLFTHVETPLATAGYAEVNNVAGTTYYYSTNQFVFGNHRNYGVWLGEQFAGGEETEHVLAKMRKYNVRYNGTTDEGINPDATYLNLGAYCSYKSNLISLKNNSTVPMCIDVYTFVANTTTADAGHPTPVESWRTLSVQERTCQAGNRHAYTDVGIVPFDTAQFSKYWTKLTKMRICLQADESFTFAVNGRKGYYAKKRFHDAMIVKGYTKYPVIVVNPDPTFNTLGSGITTMLSVLTRRVSHYRFAGGVGIDSMAYHNYSDKTVLTQTIESL